MSVKFYSNGICDGTDDTKQLKFDVSGITTGTERTITVPDASGTMLASTAVSASTTNTVTNKVAINIGGTTYYLLASTSGT